MDRIDTIISGIIGVGILLAFIIGLANSINALPFWIIVLSVSALALLNFYEECIRKKR